MFLSNNKSPKESLGEIVEKCIIKLLKFDHKSNMLSTIVMTNGFSCTVESRRLCNLQAQGGPVSFGLNSNLILFHTSSIVISTDYHLSCTNSSHQQH